MNIFTHRVRIIELYPELAKVYSSASGGCSACKRRQIASKIKKEVARLGVRGNIEELLYLKPGKLNETSDKVITPKQQPTPNIPLSKKKRPVCENCVQKHLSQAYILLMESLQGYDEHVGLAQGHLTEAYEEGHGKLIRVDDVKVALREIERTLNLIVTPTKAIGHLGLASDNLLKTHPELAEEIRQLRIKLQNETTSY